MRVEFNTPIPRGAPATNPKVGDVLRLKSLPANNYIYLGKTQPCSLQEERHVLFSFQINRALAMKEETFDSQNYTIDHDSTYTLTNKED